MNFYFFFIFKQDIFSVVLMIGLVTAFCFVCPLHHLALLDENIVNVLCGF